MAKSFLAMWCLQKMVDNVGFIAGLLLGGVGDEVW